MLAFTVITGLTALAAGVIGLTVHVWWTRRAGKTITLRAWVTLLFPSVVCAGSVGVLVAPALRDRGLIAYDTAFDWAAPIGLALFCLIGIPFLALDLRDSWRKLHRPFSVPDPGGETEDTPDPE
jgi:hypothetical protein